MNILKEKKFVKTFPESYTATGQSAHNWTTKLSSSTNIMYMSQCTTVIMMVNS